jgi:hypothetical protein
LLNNLKKNNKNSFKNNDFYREATLGGVARWLSVTKGVIELRAAWGPEHQNNLRSGKRGKIKGFSARSRHRMITRVLNMKNRPEWFQGLTFPDDVVPGTNITDLYRWSSCLIKKFKERCEYEFPKLTGIWRRQWKRRKSGAWFNKIIPHLHLMLQMEECDYKKIGKRLAEIWIEVIKTEHPDALKVHQSDTAIEPMDSARKTVGYVAKYIGIVDDLGESADYQPCGRAWGEIGRVEYEPEREIYLGTKGLINVRRTLKKLMISRWKMGKKAPGSYKALKGYLGVVSRGFGWVVLEQEWSLKLVRWFGAQGDYTVNRSGVG